MEETLTDILNNESKNEIRDVELNKKSKSGIVYISKVPKFMNVKILREYLIKFGNIGRIFLKADDKSSKSSKNRIFSEGWVEFLKRRDAKVAAANLNNHQVGGKRKNPWYYDLWNIKYLKKFQWIHLNERVAYERAVRRQRLKIEIGQAKREAIKFSELVEKEKLHRKKSNKNDNENKQPFLFRQKENLSEERKKLKGTVAGDRQFLKNIFSGGMD